MLRVFLGLAALVAITIAVYFAFVSNPTVFNETRNWKTYTDTEQGFEFKYPESCTTSSDGLLEGVQLSEDVHTADEKCNFSIMYYDNLNAISIGVNLPRKNISDFAKDPNLSQTRKIDFLGNEALSGIFENKGVEVKRQDLYVHHNDHLYHLSYMLVSGERIFNTQVPEKILSTFKFTR